MKSKSGSKSAKQFELVFADKVGKVYNFPGLRPAGMKAGLFFGLEDAPLVQLPDSSELFLLPDRSPVGFDPETGELVTLGSDPYSESEEPVFAVAAFVPPGYTLTHNAAYVQAAESTKAMPLFAYGACFFSDGHFYVTAVKVDSDVRHDEKYLSPEGVFAGIW